MDKEVVPATNPLSMAIRLAPVPAILLVRLLSRPQRAIANTISATPSPEASPFSALKVNIAPAAVIRTTAVHVRFPTGSPNIRNAMRAVATPSKFRSSEEAIPVTEAMPVMRRMGAITPPERIEPARYGSSDLFRAASFSLSLGRAA